MQTIQDITDDFNNDQTKLSKISDRIRELSYHNDVIEYIKLSKEKERLEKEMMTLEEKIKEDRMWHCHHMFIITSRNKSFGEPIFYCLRCGLTNYYFEKDIPKEKLTPLELEMAPIFEETRINGILISNEVITSIKPAVKLLNNLVVSLPDITDETLAEQIKISFEKGKNKTKKLKR